MIGIIRVARVVGLLVSLLAIVVPYNALAVQPDEVLADAALEKRARALSAGLRCVVCQNQSIDDSDAPLAGDLRRLVRERLLAGDSDEQVISAVVGALWRICTPETTFCIAHRNSLVAPVCRVGDCHRDATSAQGANSRQPK